MVATALVLLVVAVLAIAALRIWRWADGRRDADVWRSLAGTAPASPQPFAGSMVDDLPDPARRFFLFTIRPGTPIHGAVEIRMHGEIALGSKAKPNYAPMRGHQILAPPHGLVWKLNADGGAVRISGSDGIDQETSWTRLWLFGAIPVVRVGGGRDHARAAFGRVVAESVFWAPAALLPQNAVTWETVSDDTARATISLGSMVQTVDVQVANDGRPISVTIPRWSNANPMRTYQVQPFGGYLSEFQEFDGYTLPTHVEGGNFIGTDDYFPFYKAVVDDIRFVSAN